jgi:ribosomal protein S18 acetylase RimI-like enzyme
MPSRLTIKSLTEQDIMAIKELFKSSGPYVAERGVSDYWLYTRLFNNTCIGVKDGETLVGALLSFCDQTRDYKEIYIQDIAVSPKYRGVGLFLIKELISRAKVLGVSKIWLTSEVENEKATKLWDKLGFKNKKADYLDHGLWVTRDLKGPGRDRVVFSLELERDKTQKTEGG